MQQISAIAVASFDLAAPLAKIQDQIEVGGILVLTVVGVMKAFSVAKRMLRGA